MAEEGATPAAGGDADGAVREGGPAWPPRMVGGRRRRRGDVWEQLDRAVDPTMLRPQLAPYVELKEFSLRWGEDYAVVANRRDLVHYRLDPVETALVKRFDGTSTVGDIVVDQLADVPDLSLPALADLTLQLQAGRFFTSGGGDVDEALRERLQRGSRLTRIVQRLVRSQPIEWRGVERPVAWLYRRGLRFAFHPAGAAVLAVLSLAGLFAFLRIASDAPPSLDAEAPALEGLLLVLMSYALTICHELGHALVLVHYGRRVRSAGFTIYFGSPAMFIDSTDGLMLERRQRILQSFGGPFAELVLAGVAALGAWLLAGSTVGEVLLRFAVLNYFVLFLNLIPLLELDGYWIFSDLIQVPDLRPRSLAFVRHGLWERLRSRRRLTLQEVGLTAYAVLGIGFTVLSLVGAFFFWRHIVGSVVTSLWGGGIPGRLLLAVLAVVLGGPVARALIDALRVVARIVRDALRRLRFRLETPWRIEGAELLDASGRFEDLPVEVLNDLAGRFVRRLFDAGQAVTVQGERAAALYVVRTGALKVTERDTRTGEERHLRDLGRGDVFGEVGLLSGGLRTATVTTATRTEVLELPKSAFDHLLVDDLIEADVGTEFHDLDELRRIGCFAALPSVDLLHAAGRGRWEQVAPGEEVVRQGERASAFYGLRSGQVEVLVGGEVVDVLGPGSCFGERGLLEGGRRQATVRARTPVRVFRLEREDFDRILRSAFRAPRRSERRPERRSWEH